MLSTRRSARSMSETAERGIPVCSATNCCKRFRNSRASRSRLARCSASLTERSAGSRSDIVRRLDDAAGEVADGPHAAAGLLVSLHRDPGAVLERLEDVDDVERIARQPRAARLELVADLIAIAPLL